MDSLPLHHLGSPWVAPDSSSLLLHTLLSPPLTLASAMVSGPLQATASLMQHGGGEPRARCVDKPSRGF